MTVKKFVFLFFFYIYRILPSRLVTFSEGENGLILVKFINQGRSHRGISHFSGGTLTLHRERNQRGDTLPDKSKLHFTTITGFKKIIRCAGCREKFQAGAYERFCGKCQRSFKRHLRAQNKLEQKQAKSRSSSSKKR